MRVKRLELIGFKSFAQKTVLDFSHGITAIVGPNGAGKSNIVNALSWLLGEREAYSLRGAKLQDLIFAGTPKRPALGLAQASILLDSSTPDNPASEPDAPNAFLAISERERIFEETEMSIQRKIFRDGTSSCFLNQNEVRLKNLIDFLARARLGIRGMAVVNQGESDIFLKSNPRERREMIEEILGLSEFQLKRAEAERKLTITNINVDKIRALINELAPHIRLLRRQTQRWNKRQDLENELKDLERIYFGNSFLVLNQGFQEINIKKVPFIQLSQKLEKELRGLEKQLNQFEQEDSKDFQGVFYSVKQKEEALNAKKSQLFTALGRIEAQLELAEKKDFIPVSFSDKVIKSLIIEVEEFLNFVLNNSDLEEIRLKAQKLKETFQNLIPKVDDHQLKETLLKEKEKIETELSNFNNQLALLRKEEAALLAKKEEYNKSLRTFLQLIEAKKNELREIKQKLDNFNLEEERFNFKLRDWEVKIQEAGWSKKDFEAATLTSIQNYSETEVLEKKIMRLRGLLAAIGEVDHHLLKEAQDTEEHYQFLNNQLADLEKSSRDLIALSRDLKTQIQERFTESLKLINTEFDRFFRIMFGGGRARLILEKKELKNKNQEELENEGQEKIANDEEEKWEPGIEVEVNLPRKRIKSLEMLSGGERTLTSLAVLFSLISISPPPFLVLDEIDATLDEKNARRFAEILKGLKQTQFILITHNRATMEAADVLYGITMGEDGVSRILSLKLES